MNNFNQSPAPTGHLRKSRLLIVILLIIGLGTVSLASTNFINRQVGQIYQQKTVNDGSSNASRLYTAEKQLQIEGLDNVWNVYGAAKPKVTIVEFGDFTCPYCRQDFPIVRSIMTKYPETVKFIWRDRFPTERSLRLAMFAQCAGAQGKFWSMHDKLFQNQSDTLGSVETATTELFPLAESINLDMAPFRLCLKNQPYLPKLRQSMVDSIALGDDGTPTFFINGKKYLGVLSEEDFEKIIEELK